MDIRSLAAGLLGVGVGMALGYVVGKEKPAVAAPGATAPVATQPADPAGGKGAGESAQAEARADALRHENDALKAQILTLRAQLARARPAGGPRGPGGGGPGLDPALPALMSAEEVKALAKSAASLVDELRKAMAAGDQPRRGYLQSILWQYLAADPAGASREVLDLLAKEAQPEMLELLSEVLMENDDVRRLPDVKAAFLGMTAAAEDATRRRLGIDYLSRGDIGPGEIQDVLLRCAQNDAERELRTMAYQVLTAPMSGLDDETRSKLSERVLGMLKGEKEAMVRAESLLALDLAQTSEGVTKGVLDYLHNDPDEGVRAAAAESLSDARGLPKPQLLTELETSYGADRSEPVQRSLLSSILRVGGADALPALERMARVAGPLQKEVTSYVELMKSGITDPDELEAERARRAGDPEPLRVFGGRH